MRRGRRTVPPSISGTPQRRQNTPSTASSSHDAQVAPQGELQAARDGMSGDGGDDRLLAAGAASGPSAPSPSGPIRSAARRRSRFRSAPAQNVPPAPVRTADRARRHRLRRRGTPSASAAAVGRDRRRCARPAGRSDRGHPPALFDLYRHGREPSNDRQAAHHADRGAAQAVDALAAGQALEADPLIEADGRVLGTHGQAQSRVAVARRSASAWSSRRPTPRPRASGKSAITSSGVRSST